MRGKFGSHAVDLAPMASLGQWVRKVRGVSEGLDLAFRDTFHALTSFGLKRDQNVYIFALSKYRAESKTYCTRWSRGRLVETAFVSPRPALAGTRASLKTSRTS